MNNVVKISVKVLNFNSIPTEKLPFFFLGVFMAEKQKYKTEKNNRLKT